MAGIFSHSHLLSGGKLWPQYWRSLNMNIPIIFAKFNARRERTKFVYDHFRRYLESSVLDVGCYEAPLRELLGRQSYVGIDIAGNPDIEQNLNLNVNLPFENGRFNTVLAIETLEHIDNLHALFSELVRVSNKYLIVSLPNCWRDARKPIERGRGSFAHYGLPIEPPVDRHRWFFNFSQAVQFYRGMANLHGLKIDQIFGTEQPRNIFMRLIRKMRYGKDGYRNRYVQTAWVVFKKE